MNHRLFKDRLVQILAFSLLTNFLSLKIRQFLSKTLDFLFNMDSLFFSADSVDDDAAIFGTSSVRTIYSLSDLDDERLYLVNHRWWSETREALFKEIDEAVAYGASSCLVDDFESEIVLKMRRSEDDCEIDCENVEEELGGSGREYALVSEWMFYRALKWHFDMENVGNFAATEYNKADLFSLQVRLSTSGTTNSLVVKISQKGNEIGSFNKACQIFCVKPGVSKIWDFSGQITKLFLQGNALSDLPEQGNEEIFMELQVYGLYIDIMRKENQMAVDDWNGSLKVNGHSDKVNSYVRYDRQPLTNSFSQGYNLGLTGLFNLGNTCFMNSAIQCLVHTPQLVDYFLGDFRKDLNFENPLGMNGKLALAFGDLLRQLWTPGATSVGPRAFKSRLSGFAPQFSGYNQHDSQEFLAFLLDGLHEDLNRVKIKPYNEIKDADGISDKEVADEHWQNHLARNDSIIVDMCQGQYRSTLICPLCTKHSVTFDPFLYLSLPLPSTKTRTMTLTVLSTDGTTLPIPVSVTVPKNGKFKDLIQALSAACSLGDHETLLVAEVYNNCILHFLDKPADSIELVRDHDLLVAYRLLKDEDSLPLVVFTHFRFEDSRGFQPHRKFGIPLAARIPYGSDGSEIHKKFLQVLRPFLMPEEFSLDVFDDPVDANQETDMDDKVDGVAVNDVLNTELDDKVDGVAVNDILNTELDDKVDGVAVNDALNTELDDKADDMAINDVLDIEKNEKVNGIAITDALKSDVNGNFEFYEEHHRLFSESDKIVMDEPLSIPESRKLSVFVVWPDEMLRRYDTSILSHLPETWGFPLLANKPPESVSLHKCLEAFLKEEPLGPEDMWYCPKCMKHCEASKKLDFWRLPEVLIIHLKRFSYNRFIKDKLETFVDFPIDDFDLSNYAVHKDSQPSLRYKLYAVSNHYGGMGGGHYTAFAQCGEQWYEFNDSQVFPISEDQIKTSAAYVLFYKRI